MRKIFNYDVLGKTLFVRVDLNSPVENGKITGSARINAHAKTIKELSLRGAKVVVLSHQGRDGHLDFISLEQHAKLLHDILKQDVHYVDDVVGERAKKAIKNLQNGQILVLDNVRFLHCETHHSVDENELITHLSPLADYYVIDALSVAHRSHSSVVGFSKKIPCFAGDILASEIDAVSKVRHSHDVTFVFGGSKVDDSFAVMKKWLTEGRAREVLVSGALSVLLLYAKGHSVGDSYDYLKNSGLLTHVPDAKILLDQFGDKIILPVDVGLSVAMKRVECDADKIQAGQIWDIGEKTIKLFIDKINNASCIVMNGPAGVYELEDFSKGTNSLLRAVADCDAFSLLGGGHTITAIEKLNIDKKYFGYVSLSGKALIEYICGKSLPGLVMLDENELHFPNIHATKTVNR